MTEFDKHVGKSQCATDVLDCVRSNALEIALGGAGALQEGDPLPLLYHWLYFWEVRPPAGLGVDGHPSKGGFLPPIPLPRRMWAGGRLTFHKPLLLGERVTRTSTIISITEKSGRSGTLVFVTVRHELASGSGAAITEEQDLVYRAASAERLLMPRSMPAPAAAWAEEIDPDPILLFRYSALTMNGHRIHYDVPYAIVEEDYPGLVVHGPLQATMLAAMAIRHLDAPVAEFSFRGQQPALCGITLHVCGEPLENGARLWTQQGEAPSMVATLVLAETTGARA